MKIGESSGIQKCPNCLRKKKEAIDEQIKLMKICSDVNCPFKEEIQDAIQAEEKKPKFYFGDKQKPKLKIGKKQKMDFTFGTIINK